MTIASAARFSGSCVEDHLHCPKCGTELPEGAATCPACGESVSDLAVSVRGIPATSEQLGIRGQVAYAGFWLRVVAYLIDSLLLGVVLGIVVLVPLMARAGLPADNPWVLFTGSSRQILAINLLMTMGGWLYWAGLESSAWQATLGKRALGLQVTDLAGRRISLIRASGRHFGKIIIVGCILAVFTPKKQALHDILAGCLVLRKV
jgi:uncharacterized RDD family membrane protein YckC